MAAQMYKELTQKQIAEIVAIAKQNGGIHAKEFSRIAAGKNATKTKSLAPRFSFACNIVAVASGEIHVAFRGRHYSKNDISTWPLRRLLAYKKSIKKAFADAAIINRKIFPKTPYGRVEIRTTIALKRSRDDDNTFDTLKAMRDCCVVYGIIKDDSRDVVVNPTLPEEIISSEYSIVMKIKCVNV